MQRPRARIPAQVFAIAKFSAFNPTPQAPAPALGVFHDCFTKHAPLLAHARGRLTPAGLGCMRETVRRMEFENARWDRSGTLRF